MISAPAPSKPLRPLHPPPSVEALEKKALKLLQATRHEREERGHVADVIAGWTARPNIPFSQWGKVNEGDTSFEYSVGGADKEKELRRLAQKGAVRLFNAIKAAQSTEKNASDVQIKSKVSTLSREGKAQVKEASPVDSVISSGHTTKHALNTIGAEKGKLNLLGSRGQQEARKLLLFSCSARELGLMRFFSCQSIQSILLRALQDKQQIGKIENLNMIHKSTYAIFCVPRPYVSSYSNEGGKSFIFKSRHYAASSSPLACCECMLPIADTTLPNAQASDKNAGDEVRPEANDCCDNLKSASRSASTMSDIGDAEGPKNRYACIERYRKHMYEK